MEHEVPQSSPLSPFSCPLVRKYPVVSIIPTGKVTDLSLFWPLFFFPLPNFRLFSLARSRSSVSPSPSPSPSPLQCLGLHPLRRALALSHSLSLSLPPPLPAELNLSRSRPSASLAFLHHFPSLPFCILNPLLLPPSPPFIQFSQVDWGRLTTKQATC
ncbi:hypothetical protein BP00DRAFT_156520 [Aspergillus indologenus CBS 114.80]|uniref:Uncharacterized protein n=1 Tax=Aspergillus indologenus CBS 114.80 TaxID=1450541 RepID=A0A2V5IDV8_9EURO|nr:hypothetical protein BP00DRAFT_156520 [Aspergillus indologenus CBS 114.80]